MCLRMCSCMDELSVGLHAWLHLYVCVFLWAWVSVCVCLCVHVWTLSRRVSKYMCACVFADCICFVLDLLAVSLYLHMWMPVFGFAYHKVWSVFVSVQIHVLICISVHLCEFVYAQVWGYTTVRLSVHLWVSMCVHGCASVRVWICVYAYPLSGDIHLWVCTSISASVSECED